jgi:hypothetical protein
MADPKTVSGPTPGAQRIAVARLGAITGQNTQVSEWVDVHFNPASIQLQVSNELKDTRNNERKQYIAKSNAKLTMELQFDTTDTGDDVTDTTRKVQAFIAPPLPASQRDRKTQPPPIVVFEWGRLKFQGITESYKETIDFFSAGGVPLRAAVTLTISRQDQVFDSAPEGAPPNAGNLDENAFDTAPASPADIANAGESPGAARAIAALNGAVDLRFSAGVSLTVGASVSLNPPAAFAAGGGLDIGGGAGIGLSAGAGISAGAGAGVSGLAQLSATEGAFAGLRATAGAGASGVRLNTSRLLPQIGSASLSTDRNASFQVGGKATLTGAAGLRADVGSRSSLNSRLSFDDV